MVHDRADIFFCAHEAECGCGGIAAAKDAASLFRQAKIGNASHAKRYRCGLVKSVSDLAALTSLRKKTWLMARMCPYSSRTRPISRDVHSSQHTALPWRLIWSEGENF